MKKLTKGQRFALAREARRLAMECLENGPQFLNWWCGCSVGVSMKRAGLWGKNESQNYRLAAKLDAQFSGCEINLEMGAILSEATRKRMDGEQTAVVMPLLAWADELEASAASARQRPQKQSPAVP